MWLYFRLTVPPRLHSDFETYRYLAEQGFLPGYNFPRLPLMAFIPARLCPACGYAHFSDEKTSSAAFTVRLGSMTGGLC
jgi:hypothetical protein